MASGERFFTLSSPAFRAAMIAAAVLISPMSILPAFSAPANKPMSTTDRVREFLDRGSDFERAELYVDAIKAYESALEFGGRISASPIVYQKIAFCYERLGQLKKALRYYNEAGGRGAVQQEFYLGRGGVLERLNEWKLAQKDYARAVKLSPYNGESRGRLGRAKLRRGFAESGLKDLMAADQLLPDQGWILYEIAIALYRLDRIDESAGYLRRSMASGYTPPEPEWAAVILSASAPTGRFSSYSERNP
jgi:tetratricopeptide (TPR) repeat protein